MAQNSISKSTSDRLEKYNVFSEATITTVASFAEKQNTYKTYQAFFKDIGISKPKLFVATNGAGVPYVDISAKKKSSKGVIILHLPMANPLDENQLYHIATVAGTNPDYRVIAFGNPSGKPYKFKQQNLSFWQKASIAFTKNSRALVEAELEYLASQKLGKVHHVGYSYGAHKAMIESFYSDNTTASMTLIDPVAHPRGFRQLVHDFKNTFHPMGEYVNRTQLQTYFDARKTAAETRHHDHALTRPINIAIGVLLRRIDFVTLFEKVLEVQPSIAATVAWGSESELGNDAHMKVSMHRLKYESRKNIQALRLVAGKHALANDIHLYAAIIKQAISRF